MKTSKLLLYTIMVLSVINLSIPSSHAKIGTGRLYVYYDPDYKYLVDQEENGFYEVLPGSTVYIKVAGIEEFDPEQSIIIKICWDYTRHIGPLVVLPDRSVTTEWTVGEFDDGYQPIPACETMTVHYREDKGPEYIATPDDYFNTDKGMSAVAHLHVVPENPLGTLGTISALFLGIGLYLLKKGKSQFIRTLIKVF